MVCDFSDIKRIVKGWIDRELDHKMVLRHDDPLVEPLKALGEPMFLVDSNPDGRADRAADLRLRRRPGPAGRARQGLGDADVVRGIRRGETDELSVPNCSPAFRLIVFDLDGTLVDSRRDLAESANALLVECGCAPLPEEAIGRMVGDGAATLVARAFAAAGCPQPPDALARFLAIYNARLLQFTRPYPGIAGGARGARAAAAARGADQQAARVRRARFSTGSISRGSFGRTACSAATVRFRASPIPPGCGTSCDRAGVDPAETLLVGDSVVDWRTARAAGTRVCLAGYGFGFEGFPVGELERRRSGDRLARRHSCQLL